MCEEFTYAIIGGGIAGVTCAEHLEILDGEHKVVLISGSDLIKSVTNVLHLTKSLDIFDVEEKHHAYLAEICPSVTVKPAIVKQIQAENKVIELSTGEQIKYRTLCVCTGAVPKVLFPGHPHVLYIRDTESVQNFMRRISTAKRIVIVGNGGIATEMVYEISGVEVIWAVKDSWFTSAFIDPGAAEFFKPELTKKKDEDTSVVSKRRKYCVDNFKVTVEDKPLGGALGPDWHSGLKLSGADNEALHQRKIQLETEVEVLALHNWKEIIDKGLVSRVVETPNIKNDKEWAVYVELSNGKIFGCDLVVSAIGVTANTSLLQGFKLADDGGVAVDENMCTSVKDVYAAGDVCTPTWPWAAHWHQMRLWTQARQMGSYAAKCMWASVTEQQIYQDFCFELFTHATKFFGHKVVMLGLYNGQTLDGQYEILLRMTRGKEYIKVVMKDGRMQGALLVGDTDLEETFENLILNQINLDSFGVDLLDPDIDIEDYFD